MVLVGCGVLADGVPVFMSEFAALASSRAVTGLAVARAMRAAARMDLVFTMVYEVVEYPVDLLWMWTTINWLNMSFSGDLEDMENSRRRKKTEPGGWKYIYLEQEQVLI